MRGHKLHNLHLIMYVIKNFFSALIYNTNFPYQKVNLIPMTDMDGFRGAKMNRLNYPITCIVCPY